MNRRLISTLRMSPLALGWALLSAGSAAAATPITGQALEIYPPVLNVAANPGETVNLQISLRGVTPGKVLVRGEANDFVAAGEEGVPKIILDEGEPSPYSLKSWVTSLAQLTLEQKKVQILPVTVKVPTNAAPGGYYGVIRFTTAAPEAQDTGVSLAASLGTLVLLRVNGDIKEDLSVASYVTSQGGKVANVFQGTPINFTERIKNEGSIHEQPSGQIIITDMFGKKTAAINVNLPPRNILPGSIRKFEQTLDKDTLGDKQLFGRYKAVMTLTYGTSKQTTTAELSFWVIPYTLIAIVVGSLIVGFFLLRLALRRYNEHILSRGRRRR